MATTPSAADVAAKVAKLRAAAKDTSIPQDVRNQYLDKANALEQSTYRPSMAKGGSVGKPTKMAVGGVMPAMGGVMQGAQQAMRGQMSKAMPVSKAPSAVSPMQMKQVKSMATHQGAVNEMNQIKAKKQAPMASTPAPKAAPYPMMAKGGSVAKAPAKAPMKSKGAAVAIVIGVGKPKKPMMAKGGSVAKAPAKKGC